MTVETPLPPPPPPRPLPPAGRPAFDISKLRLPPPPPRPFARASQPAPPKKELSLTEAASIVQRKFRASKISRFVRRCRISFHEHRMQKTDTANLQKSKPLKTQVLTTQSEKEKILSTLNSWKDPVIEDQLVLDKDKREFTIASKITDFIIDKILQKQNGKIIAIYDDEDRLQAVAFVVRTKGCFKIADVVTAPWNLDISIFADDPRRVRGAGTASIDEAIFESFRAGFQGRVYLEAIPPAIPFYTKIGFEPLEDTAPQRGYTPMELTDIPQFFRKYGGRALPA
jgi:GNAT superfamily N-acetyltransferase